MMDPKEVRQYFKDKSPGHKIATVTRTALRVAQAIEEGEGGEDLTQPSKLILALASGFYLASSPGLSLDEMMKVADILKELATSKNVKEV